tara:strand:+ start:7596 stop:9983 length:2388 start_codon:yes stop_codon:yes gene_type:complete
MKKIFYLLITLLILSSIEIYAEESFLIKENSKDKELDVFYNGFLIAKIQGSKDDIVISERKDGTELSLKKGSIKIGQHNYANIRNANFKFINNKLTYAEFFSVNGGSYKFKHEKITRTIKVKPEGYVKFDIKNNNLEANNAIFSDSDSKIEGDFELKFEKGKLIRVKLNKEKSFYKKDLINIQYNQPLIIHLQNSIPILKKLKGNQLFLTSKGNIYVKGIVKVTKGQKYRGEILETTYSTDDSDTIFSIIGSKVNIEQITPKKRLSIQRQLLIRDGKRISKLIVPITTYFTKDEKGKLRWKLIINEDLIQLKGLKIIPAPLEISLGKQKRNFDEEFSKLIVINKKIKGLDKLDKDYLNNLDNRERINVMGEGERRFLDRTKKANNEITKLLKERKVNVAFTTPLDLCNRGFRTYSNDPNINSILGYENTELFFDNNIYPTLKHFPGGDCFIGETHEKLVEIKSDFETMRKRLYPFKEIINKLGKEGKYPNIMMGHGSYPELDQKGTPASLSPEITGIARKMCPKCLIITDEMHMGVIKEYYKGGKLLNELHGEISAEIIKRGIEDNEKETEKVIRKFEDEWEDKSNKRRVVDAILAGNDVILMFTTEGDKDIPVAINAIIDAVKKGLINEERIDESVQRILRVKKETFGIDVDLSSLTLNEKIGQMFFVATYFQRYDQLYKKLNLGGAYSTTKARLEKCKQSSSGIPCLSLVDSEIGIFRKKTNELKTAKELGRDYKKVIEKDKKESKKILKNIPLEELRKKVQSQDQSIIDTVNLAYKQGVITGPEYYYLMKFN